MLALTMVIAVGGWRTTQNGASTSARSLTTRWPGGRVASKRVHDSCRSIVSQPGSGSMAPGAGEGVTATIWKLHEGVLPSHVPIGRTSTVPEAKLSRKSAPNPQMGVAPHCPTPAIASSVGGTGHGGSVGVTVATTVCPTKAPSGATETVAMSGRLRAHTGASKHGDGMTCAPAPDASPARMVVTRHARQDALPIVASGVPPGSHEG
jgi:hypothetical protein